MFIYDVNYSIDWVPKLAVGWCHTIVGSCDLRLYSKAYSFNRPLRGEEALCIQGLNLQQQQSGYLQTVSRHTKLALAGQAFCSGAMISVLLSLCCTSMIEVGISVPAATENTDAKEDDVDEQASSDDYDDEDGSEEEMSFSPSADDAQS